MGHEFVGTIISIGDQVKTFSIGDRVVSSFSTCCGECYFCVRELSSRCEHPEGGKTFGWRSNGVGNHGAQAEYIRVPIADGTLLRLPENIPDDVGLFIGDILATGYFAAAQGGIAELKRYEGKVAVAVVGCGPVGIMTILSARYLGADVVFGIDFVEERRELAERFGAIALDPSVDDVRKVVMDYTDGRGVDCACECVGSQKAGRMAYELLRLGGTLSSVGVQTEDSFNVFNPIEGYDKNITYRSGRCPVRSLMPKIIPLVSMFDLSVLISHRVNLNDPEGVEQAYDMFLNKSDQCTKVIFLN
jgi:threonine dehydrogenase-like Zn-dependent dehydrogenase